MTENKGQDIQKPKMKRDYNLQQITAERFRDETNDELRVKQLQKEISEALVEWKLTEKAFEFAVGDDQVEYAIYQMMAAEQKYRMLLNVARSLDVNWSEIRGYVI